MGKSYLICNIKKFNSDDFMVSMQQDLLEEVEGEPEINIAPKSKEYYMGFDQFLCHHDFIHKKTGKVFNKTFNYYFEPLDFYFYYRNELELGLVQTKTDVAIDFINKLNSTGLYSMEPININFNKMIPFITEVAGAWIAGLKRTHLKTAGFFGPNVHKSEEYIEAAAEGDVSSIQINYISKKTGEEHYIVISKKGSIVLYDTFETLEEEIELIMEIYSKLIRPHL